MKDSTYQEEIQYLISNENRNKFIKNLAVSLGNNTLILYQMVDKHGQILYDMIKDTKNIGDRKVFFIHGGTDVTDREEVRRIMEIENDAIVVASFGTFSTGINIRNLHNIIFASPSKSRVRNLQSIGRGLRQSEGKEKAILYDIADDLRYKKHMNFTLKHFVERIKIYNEEKFPFKIYKIGLKK
jgi:superfamily II DNA or RNA helicase